MDPVKEELFGLISITLAPLDLAMEGNMAAGITSPVVPISSKRSALDTYSTDLLAASVGIPSPKKTKSGLSTS